MPSRLNYFCVFIVFVLGIFVPSIICDLPGDDMPNLTQSSCSTHDNCLNYYYSRCSGGSCTACSSNTECLHFASNAYCNGGRCIIPCSSATEDICRLQRVRCSPTENRCIQCYADADCVGYPSPVYCQANGPMSMGLCVNCRNVGDCPGGFICQNYKCQQCSSDGDCTAPTPYCIKEYQQNACKQCKQNTDCPNAASSQCSSSNSCAGCSGNGDCTHISGKPVCSSGTCAECASNTDCTNPAKSLCSSGICVPCSTHPQCSHLSPNTYCLSGTCINAECTTVGECTNLLKSNCNFGTKFCEICTYGSGQCSHITATPLCAGSPNGCVQCLSSTDCPTEATSVCNSAGTCQRCLNNNDCTKFSLKPICDTSVGCVECTSISHCTNPAKSNCVSASKTCQLCTVESECNHLPATPHCSGTSFGCVECMSTPDCTTTAKSYCYPSTHICQSCFKDSHCSHLPNVNKCWYGECVIYSPVCVPTYSVSIIQEKTLNDFVIEFDATLVTKINILSTIKIKLVDIESVYYSYTVVKVTDTQFKVKFQVQKTIPKTKIEVEVPCPTQPGYVYGNITKEINTLKIPYASDELKAALATLGSAATAATTAVGGISGAMMFMGANPMILWGLLGSIQTFYYMLFINVQYPANVKAFFPIFALGNLDFIPNPTWVIFPNINDFSLPVPARFEEHEVDGLFLANAGNMVFLWIGNIALYGFSYLIKRYTRNMPKLLAMVCVKVVETFEWSGIIRVFITSYMELTIAAFLQLRVLDFASGLFSASSICGILFGTFGVILPVFMYKIVQRYDTNPKYIKFKFGTLIEGYKLNDDIHKFFTVISIGRNLILAASLVYLHNYPYIEIITLMTLSFSFAYLLFKYKPYENKVSNISNFISELVFGMVHIFIFILIHDDYSPSFSDEQRMNLGWGIIAGCGIILMSSMALAITEQVSVAINMIRLLKQVLKKEKKTRVKRIQRLSNKIRRVKREAMQAITNESMATLNQLSDITLPSLRASVRVNQSEIRPTQMVIKRPVNITPERRRKIKR